MPAVPGNRRGVFLKRLGFLFACLSLAVPVKAAWFSGSGPDYSQGSGNSFYCANLAGTPVTTVAGLSSLNPALILVNPYTSRKNLVILDVGIEVTAAPAAAVGFMLAYSTGAANAVTVATSTVNAITFTTMTTVVPALLPSTILSTTTVAAQSVGQCFRGATLPNTPVAFRYLGGTTGAAAISGVQWTDQTQGKVVVPPGVTVSIQTTSAASVLAHILWREDPQ